MSVPNDPPNPTPTDKDAAGSKQTSAFSERLAGKYMTFKLGAEEYALRILKVRELIGLMDITRVPHSDDFIRGVINLRGKIIPVMDLRTKFGMGRIEPTDQTVIIVVQHATNSVDVTMGVLVDQVVEVLDIPATAIDPPPNFGTAGVETEFIMGMGKTEGRLIFLLNIGRVLNPDGSSELLE